MGLLLSSAVGFTEIVQAEETDLAISIVKYKITDLKQVEDQLPIDGTKADAVTDSNGNTLSPLAGISYTVTRVSPVQGTTNFQAVQGADAFSTTITTDATGTARVSGLAQGTYQISEEPNEQLKEVMEPVVLELPLPQRSGPALNEVFLYPKSSIVDKKGTIPKTPGSPSDGNTGEKPSGRLPQTSGNIGTYSSFVLILAFLVLMGILGGGLMNKNKHHY